jgi:hypothetical protein
MLKAFKKLWNDDRGNILIIAGAALPMLIGSAGIATDTIQWTLWKRELQRAADSGAIAGVYDRNAKGDTDDTEETVLHDLELNHHTGIDWVNDPVVTYPADSGDMTNQVRVVLTVRKSLPFSSMFMSAAPIIQAGATAASVPGGDTYCVIALDKRAAVVGIEIAGSSNLALGDCSLIANSTNPNKAASNGTGGGGGGQGSMVTAKSLAAAGGVQNSSSWQVQNYDPYSTPADDPFEDLPTPESGDCDKNITLDGSVNTDRTALDTDSNEYVCINNLKKQGNKWIKEGLTVAANIQLGKGTYVINGGDLTMNSSNAGVGISCDGCTIILTNFGDRANTGDFKLTGGTLDINAPTDETATYKGVALYQDRLTTDDGINVANQNHVNGNSNGGVTGAIYTPNTSLLYNGGGNLVAQCMQVVAGRVKFSGNSNIQLASLCDGAFDSSGGRRVRLVA